MLAEFQTNVRLRVLTYLTIAIAWTYGLMVFSDHNAFVRQQLVMDQLHLQRLDPSAQSNNWGERQTESKERLLELSRGSWVDKSGGAVEKALRDWLTNAVVNAGINARQILVSYRLADDSVKKDGVTVSDMAALPPGYGVLTAQIDGTFSGTSFLALLESIENEPRKMAIRRVSVKNPVQGPGSLEIELRAVLKVSEVATK